MDKVNIDALLALTSKVDSAQAVTNSKLISEEYNTLLAAVKAIGNKVNEIIDAGTSTKVTITGAAGAHGSVAPTSSLVDKGASVTLTATAASGYVFDKWDDNNTSNPRTVVASASKTYTASFKAAAIGDVQLTMTTAGVVTNMTAQNANQILYSLDGTTPSTQYTSGNVTLANNNTLVAIGKNTDTGAISVIPVVKVTYDADAASNPITVTSDYDMTLDGVDKGKSFSMPLTAGTYTIVANGRTSTITIEEE